jgi:hypothetical protein
MRFKMVLTMVNTNSTKTMILKQKASKKKKGRRSMALEMMSGKIKNSTVVKKI